MMAILSQSQIFKKQRKKTSSELKNHYTQNYLSVNKSKKRYHHYKLPKIHKFKKTGSSTRYVNRRLTPESTQLITRYLIFPDFWNKRVEPWPYIPVVS